MQSLWCIGARQTDALSIFESWNSIGLSHTRWWGVLDSIGLLHTRWSLVMEQHRVVLHTVVLGHVTACGCDTQGGDGSWDSIGLSHKK